MPRVAVALGCLLLAMVTPTLGQDPRLERAVPVDPIAAVVDAFDSHRFVAILVNGFEEEHRFRLSLLNDPRFVSKVDDIVVEFGGSRYQDVMDRFIAGDEVPYNELKRSWQQTTQPHHVSDAPIYDEFFKAVRAANAKLPEQEGSASCWPIPLSTGR